MLGCFILCNRTISSYTIFSLPLTFFLRMILIANRSPAHSASRTIPYVPAPSVRPKRYCALECRISILATCFLAMNYTFCHNCLADQTAYSSCLRLEPHKVSMYSHDLSPNLRKSRCIADVSSIYDMHTMMGILRARRIHFRSFSHRIVHDPNPSALLRARLSRSKNLRS